MHYQDEFLLLHYEFSSSKFMPLASLPPVSVCDYALLFYNQHEVHVQLVMLF